MISGKCVGVVISSTECSKGIASEGFDLAPMGGILYFPPASRSLDDDGWRLCVYFDAASLQDKGQQRRARETSQSDACFASRVGVDGAYS